MKMIIQFVGGLGNLEEAYAILSLYLSLCPLESYKVSFCPYMGDIEMKLLG